MTIKERRRRNSIVSILNNEGSRIEDVYGIGAEVLRVFRSRFMEPIKERPLFDGLVVNTISPEENVFLVSEFSQEEIRVAVWEANEEKNPGPDGFKFKFYRNAGIS